MSATKLLQLLEKSGMLDKPLLAELRKQIADTKTKVTAESIAKALVDKGHLTRFQATRLVGEATAEPEAGPPAPPPASKPKPAAEKRPVAEDDELGLAPEDAAELGIGPSKGKSAAKEPPGKSPPKHDSEEDVVLLEDAGGPGDADEGLLPVEDAGARLTHVGPIAPELKPVSDSGPVDLTPAGPGLGDLTAEPFGLAGMPSTQPILPPKPPRRGPSWDTMLMYGGGLTLALLILFGIVLWYNLTRTPALEMFQAAMEDYRKESYSQAVAKFENFLKAYPDDENASEARVRVALAQLRLAVSDPKKGLETAQQLIPTIAEEKAFQVAREEFAGILPQIPEGFVKEAKLSDDMKKAEELLGQAEAGMKLVLDPANIPTSIRIRIDATILRIQEDMMLVRRAIEQDRDLAKAIVGIEEAVGAGNTVQAYDVYRTLVKKYPGLDGNERLLASVVKITDRERGLVKVAADKLEPLAADAPAGSEATVALASRSGNGAPHIQGQVAAVLAGGSVYALDVGTGQVLWRRFVGVGSRWHPQRLAEQSDADRLILDVRHQEVARVQARDGKTVWRLPLPGPAVNPVPAGRQIYAATESGQLIEIDAQTGRSARQAVLPQRLIAPPAIAPNRPRIFQVGERSNLYVLSTDTLECKDVYYLGHKPGAVDLPPLVLLSFVFVVENAGSDYALLHALSIKSEGSGPLLQPAQTPLRLAGNVRVPLVISGRRLLVLTDRGEIRVFDVDVADTKEPIKDAAKLPPVYQEPVIGYPLADASSLWVADNRLTSYRIQVTTKEITRNPAIGNVGDTFLGPLQLFQDVLVHTRRVKDSAGVAVAAVPVDNPRKPLWETRLAMPVEHVADDAQGQQVTALTADGSLYAVPRDALAAGINDRPLKSVPAAGGLSFTESVQLENGRLTLFNPTSPPSLLLYEPPAEQGKLSVTPLKELPGPTTCPPIALRNGVLLALESGEVRLIDPATGQNLALPLQPRLEPGEKIRWGTPAIVGDAGGEFVIFDSRRFVYRVGIKEQPQPFLAELASAQLEVELTAGLAAIDQTVYGVARSEKTDTVVALGLGDLKVAQQWDLQGGRVTWGPQRVGKGVLLAVDGKSLRCYDAGNKERWAQPAPALGQPTGRPLLLGEDFVLASVDGFVWRIAGSTGQLAGKSEAGGPLTSGPATFGDRLLVGGSDGAVHLLPLPAGP